MTTPLLRPLAAPDSISSSNTPARTSSGAAAELAHSAPHPPSPTPPSLAVHGHTHGPDVSRPASPAAVANPAQEPPGATSHRSPHGYCGPGHEHGSAALSITGSPHALAECPLLVGALASARWLAEVDCLCRAARPRRTLHAALSAALSAPHSPRRTVSGALSAAPSAPHSQRRRADLGAQAPAQPAQQLALRHALPRQHLERLRRRRPRLRVALRAGQLEGFGPGGLKLPLGLPLRGSRRGAVRRHRCRNRVVPPLQQHRLADLDGGHTAVQRCPEPGALNMRLRRLRVRAR